MTHTLQDLNSGKLIGTKRLKLACGLKQFPEAILTLFETLEILDLSDNQLTTLPDTITQLKHLKIIFFARNHFTAFPKILSKLPVLNMIGFKSNQIKTVPEHAFPPKLNWLILTDNHIQKLPQSIGNCTLLQKCALAGNQIEVLPDVMKNCKNLELLRVSANQLKTIPEWLFELPKLAWVAFGGNPVAHQIPPHTDLKWFDWNDFELNDLLGEGASGFIYKAHWEKKKQAVAIKIFKGAVTSDGLPEDEMQLAIAAGLHSNLISVLGKIENHPKAKNGLIMTLIPPAFINLGQPPNFETCTRDVFDETTVFNSIEVFKIAKSMASVCAQLHCRGIIHGDFYAHNILVNKTANTLLGDFGAASFYDINSELAHCIERVEVRAYACLLEDLLTLGATNTMSNLLYDKWQHLITDCMQANVKLRPSFLQILKRLEGF